MNEEEIKTVSEEINVLVRKMKNIVSAGGDAIDCAEVCRHLVRILDAHYNETEKIRDDFLATLNGIRDGVK